MTAAPSPRATQRQGTTQSASTQLQGTSSREQAGTRVDRGVLRGGGPLFRVSVVLAVAMVLAQIAYPLTTDSHRPALTVGTVMIFAAASLSHAAAVRGLRWTGAYAVTVVCVGLGAEVLGVKTGVPFGEYAYADSLGPTLWGVPVVIPAAWTMMAYPAYVVARHLVPHCRLVRVGVAAWALATWDLFLDPQMVGEGHWSWADQGPQATALLETALPGVPDIPVSNYLGWLTVGLLIMSLVEASARLAPPTTGRLSVGPDWVPLGMYLWTYFSSLMAAVVFFGNPGAALWGGLAMGSVAIPTLVYVITTSRTGNGASAADEVPSAPAGASSG